MYSTSDIRNGLKIEMDGYPYEVLQFEHSKVGRGGAHIKTKLRNLMTGGVMDHTFRSGEKINKPDLMAKDMQFLYRDSDYFVFMDMESYEQVEVDVDTLKDKGGYLTDGQEVKVLTYNGKVIDLQLPASTVMRVADTEPGIKGDTVSGASKPATLESGIGINVPLFIEPGDMVKVDTRSGDYLGRQ